MLAKLFARLQLQNTSGRDQALWSLLVHGALLGPGLDLLRDKDFAGTTSVAAPPPPPAPLLAVCKHVVDQAQPLARNTGLLSSCRYLCYVGICFRLSPYIVLMFLGGVPRTWTAIRINQSIACCKVRETVPTLPVSPSLVMDCESFSFSSFRPANISP
jgi:hypothetical protein